MSIHCAALALVLLGLLALSATAAEDATAPLRATLTVTASRVLGPVPPLLFGQNLEAADSQFIFGPHSNPVPGRTGDGVWDPRAARPVPELVTVAKELGVSCMRYPGGCLVHNFDWKKTIGPVAERPNFTFGLAEFVVYCRALGAEPLITTSAYIGGPRDSADLVEYLNAPADAAHPWARKRAAQGFPEPFRVTWFEMGNESDHGNHDVKPFRKHTPQSYAQWVIESAKLMRAVDPRIKIGALTGTGTGPQDPWNPAVLTATRDDIDYVIVHTYPVNLWQKEAPPDPVMRACLAVGEQTGAMLAEYRALIRKCTGRELPMALTEYNAGLVQEKPIPYRFSFGAALFSADYLRLLLNPELNVCMANYWHFVNGYWGLIQGPRVPGELPGEWKKLPAYYCFRLWGQHFGTQLVDSRVDGPTVDFEGFLHASPARATAGPSGPVKLELRPGEGKGFRWTATGAGALSLELTGHAGHHYPPFARVAAPPNRLCRLTFEARLVAPAGPVGRLGVGLTDARGWDATKSGLGMDGIQDHREWTRATSTMVTLPDCKELDVLWRLQGTGETASGRIEVRNLELTLEKDAPPYPALTSCASLSADGRKLYVIVFNKHPARAVAVRMALDGFAARQGRFWRVSGALEETNLKGERVRETETASPVDGVQAGAFEHTFPVHSMTAFELVR